MRKLKKSNYVNRVRPRWVSFFALYNIDKSDIKYYKLCMTTMSNSNREQENSDNMPPEKRSSFFRKHWGKLIFLTLFGGFETAHLLSPEIGYVTHTAKLVENPDSLTLNKGLDSVYESSHEETNQIVRLMSGFATRDDVDVLEKLYEQDTSFAIFSHDLAADTIIYDCIVQLQERYGHPHLSFGGDYRKDIIGNSLGFEE